MKNAHAIQRTEAAAYVVAFHHLEELPVNKGSKMQNDIVFNVLEGKIISEISGLEIDSDCIIFRCLTGEEYHLYHEQDCCEHVSLNDFVGSKEDILNSEILLAEEVNGRYPGNEDDEYGGSVTWTFYNISTARGDLSLTWRGESNGYYSESVYFKQIK